VHAISRASSDFLDITLAISGVHVGHGAKFVRLFLGTCMSRAYDAHVASQYVTLNARLTQCHGSMYISPSFLNVVSGN
jgi:hypothetical protein